MRAIFVACRDQEVKALLVILCLMVSACSFVLSVVPVPPQQWHSLQGKHSCLPELDDDCSKGYNTR